MTVPAVSICDQRSAPCWFVGAISGGEDQSDRFIDEGIWEHNLEASSTMLAQVRAMQAGERIAIKRAFFRKHGLPFDAAGSTVSVMAIKAIGLIVANVCQGGYLQVRWQRVRPIREWYFSSYQPPIWKVIPGDWEADALIDFAFHNKPQDIDRARSSPCNRTGFSPANPVHNRDPWARDRHPIADGPEGHRLDGGRLIAFLQQVQSGDGGPGQIRGDRSADEKRSRFPAIDPYPRFGLSRPRRWDSVPWTIPADRGRFRSVEAAVPEDCESLPELDDQASGLAPSLRVREPVQADAPGRGPQSGLAHAEADPSRPFVPFNRDGDASTAPLDGPVNRSDSLSACRPLGSHRLDGSLPPCNAEEAAFQVAGTIAIQMLEEGGRGAVLVGVAGIDMALEHLLHAVMAPANSRGDELFLPDRPLGHLGAKVALASRLGLIDAGAEQALHAMRKLRNAFAHTTASASLSDPAHRDRLTPIVAEARANPLWASLERMLAAQPLSGRVPLEPSLRDFILLVTLLVAFLEGTAQQLRPVSQPMVMGLSGISVTANPSHRF
jgi:hypothetical protein